MVDDLRKEDVASRDGGVGRGAVVDLHHPNDAADGCGLVLRQGERFELGKEVREFADGDLGTSVDLRHAVMAGRGSGHDDLQSNERDISMRRCRKCLGTEAISSGSGNRFDQETIDVR